MTYFPHCLLILVAVVLNWGDRRMLALSLVVGLNTVMPFHLFTTFESFPWACSGAEILTATLAWHLRARASFTVIGICALLVVYHLLSWWFGHTLLRGPYAILVQIAEYAELMMCVLYPLFLTEKSSAHRIRHQQ